MPTISEHVDVQVPVRTAYEQWAHFESFPSFMAGVDRVRRLNSSTMHWETSIGGLHREFDARITELSPGRIAWRSEDGAEHSGEVTFESTSDSSSRVSLRMEYESHGLTEKAGAALGVLTRRVHGDLQRFKEVVERGGTEQVTGPEDMPNFYSHTVFPGPLGNPPLQGRRIEEP
ncbi:SRPBCC family protein [Kutzneria albida]|uniref:Coenzyme Q-binding protein COQ10 START domain-containing protein n=1 Tax=Kutzneria albida DSM 43870 TaxID=1449976 RepID=W5WBX6_9PSEU|nr:SRPBCC family protein [Kutzneria albida]AHH98051.1 hypothetical protein KALB_4689 [Kutzneria albida DSM 43870]